MKAVFFCLCAVNSKSGVYTTLGRTSQSGLITFQVINSDTGLGAVILDNADLDFYVIIILEEKMFHKKNN